MGLVQVNHSLSTSTGCKNLEEIWSGKPIDYSSIKVFGCFSYIYVKYDKLDPREKMYVFIGYGGERIQVVVS